MRAGRMKEHRLDALAGGYNWAERGRYKAGQSWAGSAMKIMASPKRGRVRCHLRGIVAGEISPRRILLREAG